ncbi:hypothetical protein BB558_000130 [Smittium angustum]|uniref:SEC7 domain-containing protein n=1 Tax=Smittium angustum TaxID=133377 RepID=A0A2U1JF91_SMIAN|nr:hypothetical protein BB558_000130 [Smittium angustum]
MNRSSKDDHEELETKVEITEEQNSNFVDIDLNDTTSNTSDQSSEKKKNITADHEDRPISKDDNPTTEENDISQNAEIKIETVIAESVEMDKRVESEQSLNNEIDKSSLGSVPIQDDQDDLASKIEPKKPETPKRKSQILPSLVFVTGSIKKLLSTKDGSKKDVAPLLEKGLELLESKMKEDSDYEKRLIDWKEADELLDGIEIMCDPAKKNSSSIETSIDIIEKLVSFKCFKRLTSEDIVNYFPLKKSPESQNNSESKLDEKKPWNNQLTDLTDRLVKIVCKGFTGSSTPESTQLQIVKALLGIVLSSELKTHQDSLLRAIRTVVNVYLLSYETQNETIAQAALSQMIQVICQRARNGQQTYLLSHMERSASFSVLENNANEKSDKDDQLEGISENLDQSESIKAEMGSDDITTRDVFLIFWALSKLSMRKSDNQSTPDLKKITERSRIISLHLIHQMIKNYNDVFIHSYMLMHQSNTKTASETQSLSVPSKVNHINNYIKENETRLSKAEASSSAKVSDLDVDSSKEMSSVGKELQAVVDQALQKTPDTIGNNSVGSFSEISPVQDGEMVIPLIIIVKQYLSFSLSRNLVSTNSTILGITLQIFEAMLIYFRSYLKQEIEVLMKEIVFPILAMKHSGSLIQRKLFLKMFGRVLQNSSLVVELYINYDCDPKSQVEVFQRLTEQLCKTSGVKVDVAPSTGGPGMWEEWASFPTAQQELIEENMWLLAQDATSVFRPGWYPSLNNRVSETDTSRNSPSTASPIRSSYSSVFGYNNPDSEFQSDSPQQNDNSILRKNAIKKSSGYPSSMFDQPNITKPKTSFDSQNSEYVIRQLALNALCSLLQSMVVWSDYRPTELQDTPKTQDDSIDTFVPSTPTLLKETPSETTLSRPDQSPKFNTTKSTSNSGRQFSLQVMQPKDDADFKQIQANKQRKEKYARDIEQFNWKPKKGVTLLIEDGFIKSSESVDVAQFFWKSTKEGLINKAVLGEYLGEGGLYNIDVMHKFVDEMRFTGMSFTEALRYFLQHFRLPGEAQKIDRFMLKFAERYINDNREENNFSNANAAYVLAYSTIMLNTDQHNAQVKNRMTKDEFISNNRGINNGDDLKPELLEGIYDDIKNNEIKLKDDPLDYQKSKGIPDIKNDGGSSFFFELWRKDQAAGKMVSAMRERSAQMSNKSEQMIKEMSMRRSSKSSASNAWFLEQSRYTKATRIEHVSSMFAAIWAPVLAALSSPLQTSRDPRIILACLIGLQSGAALSCRFKLSLERTAFVTSLSKFTILGSFGEISYKHVEATRALLEIPSLRPDVGDGFEEDWISVLRCISLLDRFQLLTDSINNPISSTSNSKSNMNPPEKNVSDTVSKHSISEGSSLENSNDQVGTNSISGRQPSTKSASGNIGTFGVQSANSKNVAARKKSGQLKLSKLEPYFHTLAVAVDKIFSGSVNLSGKGIVDFVKALVVVALEGITLNSNTSLYLSSVGGNNKESLRVKSNVASRRVESNNLLTGSLVGNTSFSGLQVVSDNRDVNGHGSQTVPNSGQETYDSLEPKQENANRRGSMISSQKLSSVDHALLRHTGAAASLETPPNLYMLTRIVEIVYYNMSRIRFEWSHIWTVLGDLFDRAGSHPDARVAAFTLDSLRQLSTKFLELDELPHFQFQKQFLRPFATVLEHQCSLCVVANGNVISAGDRFIKDMVLRCVQQLVETKSAQLKSGWRSVLLVAQIAALDYDEKVASMGFDLVKLVFNHMWIENANSKFTESESSNEYEQYCELIMCLSEFAMQPNRPRLALSAVELMAESISKSKIAPIQVPGANHELYNIVTLFKALNQVVLRSDDLEIRSLALEKCYSITRTHAKEFNLYLWDFFFKQISFSLFMDMKNGNIVNTRFSNPDDIELWVSTTLVKALRLIIDLFVYCFTNSINIGNFNSELLNLLKLCICQQNETLSRIGAACLQDFIERCYKYLDKDMQTEAVELFSELLHLSQPELLFKLGSKNNSISPNPELSGSLYFGITLKCVLQLQLINSIADLFVSPQFSSYSSSQNSGSQGHIRRPSFIQLNQENGLLADSFDKYENDELMGLSINEKISISPLISIFSVKNILKLCSDLELSRKFASKFNSNFTLRRRLVSRGIMPQLPSLLRQETSSTLVQVLILERLYAYTLNPELLGFPKKKTTGTNPETDADENVSKNYFAEIENMLISLYQIILSSYNFSSMSMMGLHNEYQTFIPWPRSGVDQQGFSLIPAPRLQIHTTLSNESNSKLKKSPSSKKSNYASSRDSTPLAKGDSDSVVEQGSLEKVNGATSNVTSSLKNLSLGGDNEDENFRTVMSISDSHRQAWRTCMFAMISFLGRLSKHQPEEFKRIVKGNFNEMVKALSTATNSNDQTMLAHIQFIICCVSNVYGVGEGLIPVAADQPVTAKTANAKKLLKLVNNHPQLNQSAKVEKIPKPVLVVKNVTAQPVNAKADQSVLVAKNATAQSANAKVDQNVLVAKNVTAQTVNANPKVDQSVLAMRTASVQPANAKADQSVLVAKNATAQTVNANPKVGQSVLVVKNVTAQTVNANPKVDQSVLVVRTASVQTVNAKVDQNVLVVKNVTAQTVNANPKADQSVLAMRTASVQPANAKVDQSVLAMRTASVQTVNAKVDQNTVNANPKVDQSVLAMRTASVQPANAKVDQSVLAMRTASVQTVNAKVDQNVLVVKNVTAQTVNANPKADQSVLAMRTASVQPANAKVDQSVLAMRTASVQTVNAKVDQNVLVVKNATAQPANAKADQNVLAMRTASVQPANAKVGQSVLVAKNVTAQPVNAKADQNVLAMRTASVQPANAKADQSVLAMRTASVQPANAKVDQNVLVVKNATAQPANAKADQNVLAMRTASVQPVNAKVDQSVLVTKNASAK